MTQTAVQNVYVSVKGKEQASAVPHDGATILGVVTRISRVAAIVNIETIEGRLSNGDFQGIIRAQDVQQTNKDRVKIWASFRPGDVVRAHVISIGDARSYYLTTARNDLGVVFAHSASGTELTRRSWNEMQDAAGVIESRKVAGPRENSAS